jgi:hypothetical protein
MMSYGVRMFSELNFGQWGVSLLGRAALAPVPLPRRRRWLFPRSDSRLLQKRRRASRAATNRPPHATHTARRPPPTAPFQAYAEESLAVIKKQKELIDKLSRETDALRADLDMEVRFSQRKHFGDANLASLHDQRE